MKLNHSVVVFLGAAIVASCLLAPVSSIEGTVWTKYSGNPLNLTMNVISTPCVLYNGSMFNMWFQAEDTDGLYKIYYAFSSDGLDWTNYGKVLDVGDPALWDSRAVSAPSVLFDGSLFRMWYIGVGDTPNVYGRVGYANSTDGINWIKYPGNPVLTPGGNGGWDNFNIGYCPVAFNGTHYLMFYAAQSAMDAIFQTGVATSLDGISWTKYSKNPVLVPEPAKWDSRNTQASSVLWNGSCYYMWYDGADQATATTKFGLATSLDGFSWTKYEQNPVLEAGTPGSWDEGGVIWPSVMRKGDKLLMYYVGLGHIPPYNRAIGLATCFLPSLTAGVSFDPKCLNLVSNGKWITAYIELPADYDVANINVSTVELNNTVPSELSPTAIGDRNDNFVPDLMVKFNRTEVVNLIVSNDVTFSNVTLTVNGQLFDGTYFEGSGIIGVSSLIGDANCDGRVDIKDLVLAVFAFGSHDGDYRWNDNANFAQPWDIINLADIVKIACHYGQHYP